MDENVRNAPNLVTLRHIRKFHLRYKRYFEITRKEQPSDFIFNELTLRPDYRRAIEIINCVIAVRFSNGLPYCGK